MDCLCHLTLRFAWCDSWIFVFAHLLYVRALANVVNRITHSTRYQKLGDFYIAFFWHEHLLNIIAIIRSNQMTDRWRQHGSLNERAHELRLQFGCSHITIWEGYTFLKCIHHQSGRLGATFPNCIRAMNMIVFFFLFKKTAHRKIDYEIWTAARQRHGFWAQKWSTNSSSIFEQRHVKWIYNGLKWG